MEDKEAKFIKETERAIHSTLSPMEPFVMKIQSYLVWEKPRRSFLLFIIFHVIFFYLKFSGQRFIFILSLIALVIFIIHTWRRKIWPEIRVRPPSPEGADQWTPMHLGLLSVPEISLHLASLWCSMDAWFKKWLYLRLHHSFLFCVLNVAVLSTLAIIGRYISGFLLVYIFFTSIMVWPSVYYHDIPQKLYLYCEPVFMRLDYYLTFRGKFPSSGKTDANKDEASDDEDEFLPSVDPAVTAALARAITDSEDEEQSPPLTPHDSIHSSDENESVNDLLPSTAEMPDVLDTPDMAVSFPEKRSMKRRPRAALNADTFEPPADLNQSNSTEADIMSAVASQIVAEGFNKALASAFGTNQPEGAGSGSTDESRDVRRADRQFSQDSDIDQIISEDFDFLDEECL